MNTSNKSVTGIILAAGSGQRIGGTPKQFRSLHGKPLFLHSVEQFLKSKVCSRMILVVSQNKVAYTRRLLLMYKIEGIEIVVGGATRRQSTFAALSFLKALPGSRTDDFVMVHDAARPLITAALIRDLAKEMKRWGGAVAGVAALDIVCEAKKGFVTRVISKKDLYYGYTPQCFRFPVVWKAYVQGKINPRIDPHADSLELIQTSGSLKKIRIVMTYPNSKVTYASDFLAVEALLRK